MGRGFFADSLNKSSWHKNVWQSFEFVDGQQNSRQNSCLPSVFYSQSVFLMAECALGKHVFSGSMRHLQFIESHNIQFTHDENLDMIRGYE
jgi:hypothetical protein